VQLNIPVQPISAADAEPLLEHMQGTQAPPEWIGAFGSSTDLTVNRLAFV
jgi:hypothetical protein